MSAEEPPLKVIKYEMESQYLEGEVMDEGQEEWLSEGILTDDDYNPVKEEHDTDGQAMSQEESMESQPAEQTLDEVQHEEKPENDLPAELGAFLVRKKEPDEEVKTVKQSDDGNDTDDLLRMLEDDGKYKRAQRETDEPKGDAYSDDEYIYEGANVKSLKIAKNALLKYPAKKAIPEDDDITDASSDEMPLKRNTEGRSAKKEPKQYTPTFVVQGAQMPKVLTQSRQRQEKRETPAKVLDFDAKEKVSKTVVKRIIDVTPRKPAAVRESPRQYGKVQKKVVKTDDTKTEIKQEPGVKQKLMSPERMDEEVPSDVESSDGDESLYDELPSSDSENVDDWFTLDVRAERAGEYLPLLGDKAYQLLTEEKKRMVSRVNSLRASVTSLSENAREQSERLRRATAQLAQLDAMLQAA